MSETEIGISIIGNDRKTLRDNLIVEFLKESHGTSGNPTYYYYSVEKTMDGTTIYLSRPARLNKGVDFEVHAEGIIFHNKTRKGKIRRSSRPSHPTIIEDLKNKKIESPDEYEKVKDLIKRIYKCEVILDTEILPLKFNTGYPIELIIKIIKWLFIEQDVTYWNWSGREMFYSGIP